MVDDKKLSETGRLILEGTERGYQETADVVKEEISEKDQNLAIIKIIGGIILILLGVYYQYRDYSYWKTKKKKDTMSYMQKSFNHQILIKGIAISLMLIILGIFLIIGKLQTMKEKLFFTFCLLPLSILIYGQEERFYLENDIDGNVSLIGQYNNDNERMGVWLEFWSNGNIKYQTTYDNGIRNGDYKTFREDGSLYGYGNYREDKLDGPFIGYDEKGNIELKLEWKMGQLVSQESFNKNIKSTGTVEKFGGKKYIWLFGELKEVKEEE